MTTVEQSVLAEHQAALRGISNTQREHSRILEDHTDRLERLESTVQDINERVERVGRRLDERLTGIESEQRTMVREMSALRDFLHERLV